MEVELLKMKMEQDVVDMSRAKAAVHTINEIVRILRDNQEGMDECFKVNVIADIIRIYLDIDVNVK